MKSKATVRKEKLGQTKLIRVTAPDKSAVKTYINALLAKYPLEKLKKEGYLKENKIAFYAKAKGEKNAIFMGYVSPNMIRQFASIKKKM